MAFPHGTSPILDASRDTGFTETAMRIKAYIAAPLFLTLLGCLLLVHAPPASADSLTDCGRGIGSPSATAELDLTAQRIDNAESISTLQLDVISSWPHAKDLFQDSSSTEYQDALACLVSTEDEYSGISTKISVGLHGKYVRIKVIDKNLIYDWDPDVPSPWSVSNADRVTQLTFRPDTSLVKFTWESITVKMSGFDLETPKPLPASEPAAGQYVWRAVTKHDVKTHGKKAKTITKINILPSFNVIPDERMKLVFAAEGSNQGQAIPFDAEQLAILLAMASVLKVRDERAIDAGGRTRIITRRLCIGAAIISAVQIAADIASWQLYRFGVFSPIVELIDFLVIFALIGRLPRTSRARYVLTAIVALIAAPFVSLYVHVAWLDFLGSAYLLFFSACSIIAISCISVLRNLAILLSPERKTITSENRSARQAGKGVMIAFIIISILFQFAAGDNYSDGFPGGIYFVNELIRCLIAFGILLVIARRRRPVSVFLEREDCLLLALAVGYVMLLSGPRWYVGYEFSIVCGVAVITTVIILRVTEKRSIIKPFTNILRGKAPEELRRAQERLTRTERKVTELTSDLKAFENMPLTDEQLRARKRLQGEMSSLHRWPTSEEPASLTILEKKRRRALGPPDRDPAVEQEFPRSAGPADMALALGPACEAEGNLRSACLLALTLAVAPACYFALHGISLSFPQAGPVPSASAFISNFWLQLVFWAFPLLVLAVAWSPLAGRRGTGRGIQVWLFVVIPLGVHAIVNHWLDQSSTLSIVFQGALLLILLVILGLRLDLASIGQYQNVSYFELFRGYVRLNRVIAAVTILLPLVTAGLTIWNQIDSGVLQQKAPVQAPAKPSSAP